MQTSYKPSFLPEFQNYLRQRGLVLEKHIPFYARWAHLYLAFVSQARGESLPFEIGLERFLKHTSIQENCQGWQVGQAEKAIRLFAAFRGEEKGPVPPIPADVDALAENFKERMRLKHYAYSTERSYLDWFKRFRKYASTVRGRKIPGEWTSEDVRDFLSRLAVVGRVSASTQNQAFNALLFLFREVLDRSLDDIRQTVRAKRGERLPVVLSRAEVRQVFVAAEGGNRLILELLYGTGMRLMELARLRVQDIDFDRKTLYIRGG